MLGTKNPSDATLVLSKMEKVLSKTADLAANLKVWTYLCKLHFHAPIGSTFYIDIRHLTLIYGKYIYIMRAHMHIDIRKKNEYYSDVFYDRRVKIVL